MKKNIMLLLAVLFIGSLGRGNIAVAAEISAKGEIPVKGKIDCTDFRQELNIYLPRTTQLFATKCTYLRQKVPFFLFNW